MLITAQAASPCWHRRQRRARAKARALLRCCTSLVSPRSLAAVALLEAHHGSTLPSHIQALIRAGLRNGRPVCNVAWTCAWCSNNNWTSRQTCWKCKLTPEQARAECAAIVPPLPIGRAPCCQSSERPCSFVRPELVGWKLSSDAGAILRWISAASPSVGGQGRSWATRWCPSSSSALALQLCFP